MNSKITTQRYFLISLLIFGFFLCDELQAQSNPPMTCKEGPCIDMPAPLPYDPSLMYNTYFEYSVNIINGVGVPGINLPDMYLYAHPIGDFNTMLAISAPLDFRVTQSLPLIQANHGELTFSNVDPFFTLNCQGPNTGTGPDFYQNYIVTIITMENGYAEPYQSLYPELFPPSIFTQVFEEQAYHIFYCNLYYELQSELNTVASSIPMETSIAEGDIKLNLFPNPVTEFVEIQFPSEIENFSIEIFDSYGTKIESKSYLRSEQTIQINLSKMASGNYFLKFKKDNLNITRKILKL